MICLNHFLFHYLKKKTIIPTSFIYIKWSSSYGYWNKFNSWGKKIR